MSKLSERDKNLVFSGVVIGSIVTLLATLIAVTVCQNRHMFSLKDIGVLNEYTDIIEDMYYDEIDKEELRSGMYNGLFSSLDEYSAYYSAEDYKEMNESISKEFYGIGVSYGVDSYTDEFRILGIFKDSPAERAGLKVDDVLREVDGIKLSDKKMDDLSELLKGDEGTEVAVKVLRGDDTLEFTMKREQLKVTYSDSYQLTDEIGYISITSFVGDVAYDFSKSLSKVRGSKSLILDLRNNVGGDIDIMMDILRQIAPDGIVTTLRYKNGDILEYRLENGNELGYNFVILVNNNTASSSEIMTAFMQENNYAIVIGEQTFGKGIVQGLHGMSDGSAIKLTIASYKTPNGVDLGHVGLTPDIEVDYDLETIESVDDLLKDKVIIKAIEVLENE